MWKEGYLLEFDKRDVLNETIFWVIKFFMDILEIPEEARGAHFNVKRVLRHPEPCMSLLEVRLL